MAETDYESTKLPPDALVTQIERTRTDLARTIDEIADRVAPSNVARRATLAGATRSAISSMVRARSVRVRSIWVTSASGGSLVLS